MHPLAIALDTSFHKKHYIRHDGRVKRRTSLDNSCLSAGASLQLIIQHNNDGEEFTTKQRRFSLNNQFTMAVTFLAGLQASAKKNGDLDMDDHSGGKKQASGRTAETTLLAEDASQSSFDSDYDSFCDASVQEQANKEYLQTDLGASCFFEFDDKDLDITLDDADMTIDENVEDLSEATF